MTWKRSTFPSFLNTEGFHSAALAIITDEAPVSSQNFSISQKSLISLEPPLKQALLDAFDLNV